MNEAKRKNFALRVAIVLLLFIALFSLSFYIFFKIKNQLNSDVAGEILLSKEILLEHRIFPTDWFYSTEIRILNIQLLMAPLIFITKNFILSKSIANFIALIILCITYLSLMKNLKINRYISLLTLALLLSPMSGELMYYMFAGSFYIFYVIFIFLTFILWFKINDNLHSLKKKHILLTLSIVISFLLGMQGTRMLVNLYIPLFFMDLILNWGLLKKEKVNKIIARVLPSLLMLIGSIIGFGMNHILANKFHYMDTGMQNFSPVDAIGDRALLALSRIFDIFGGIGRGPLLSISGIISIICLLFSIVLLVITIHLTINMKLLEKKMQAIIVFYWVSITLTFYLCIFTNIEIMDKYFLNNCLMLIPILGIYLQKNMKKIVGVEKFITFSFLACIIIVSHYNIVYKGYISNNNTIEENKIVKLLQKKDLKFGYATFWNSNVISVLSNGDIKIANLDPRLNSQPYLWLTPARYYDKNYHRSKTFILLTKAENARMSDKLLVGYKYIIEKEGYVIYVFDKNPMSDY